MKVVNTTARLLRLIEQSRRGPDECWPWAGSISAEGYGRIYMGKGYHPQAHRIVYQVLVGPVPGKSLWRTCDELTCVNPAHMSQTSLGSAKKLSSPSVAEIREKYASGSYTQNELAEEHSIAQGTVSNIINHKTWTSI